MNDRKFNVSGIKSGLNNPLSVLRFKETQQARQNRDVVQDRSRLGRTQKVPIEKSTICQIQLATLLSPSIF